MWLFKKKFTLLNTNSLEELDRKQKLLNDAGIRTNTWDTNPFPVLGGAHMKTADWSGKRPEMKDDQRVIHHLEVAAVDQYKAMKILMEDGGADPGREQST